MAPSIETDARLAEIYKVAKGLYNGGHGYGRKTILDIVNQAMDDGKKKKADAKVEAKLKTGTKSITGRVTKRAHKKPEPAAGDNETSEAQGPDLVD